MKKTVSLLVLFCFVLQTNAQLVTYSGTVEYHLEMIKTAGGGGTDGGYDWNVSVNERRIIDGSFFVTFTGGTAAGYSAFQLTSIDENISYVNSVNNEGNDQKTSQPCYDDRLVFVETATPGDSRTQRTTVRTTRTNSDKPVIESGQMMFRGNKYTFLLMGKMKVNMTSETYTAETFPCWDTIIPPKSLPQSTTIDLPIVISGEKTIDTHDVLEGVYVKQNESGNDCNKCLGGMGEMVHGDVNCSYVSTIITSWTLVKRNKECDASVTYLKGDVKINGVPAEKGTIKIGAGDVIETGEKSRISISINNKNEIYQLGSKSKLQLKNPCSPTNYKPSGKGQAVVNFIKGKCFSVRSPGSYTREDFESDEEFEHFKSINLPWFSTTVVGVRGQNWKLPTTFWASSSTNLSQFIVQQNDTEKAELIEGFENLPDNYSALYIHFEDDEIKDISALKGMLKIEDTLQSKSKSVLEGATINKWDDGVIMSDVIISTK